MFLAPLLILARALAGDAPTASAPAMPVAATPQKAPAAAVGVVVTLADGVSAHLDLRPEYLTGFATLVAVTIQNDGVKSASFPDLSARPWLVRFGLTGPDGATEKRFTTPPPSDPGGTWTIPPKSRRSVLLEIPSSADFTAGNWQLDLTIVDAARVVTVPPWTARYAPANPVGGTPEWEHAISNAFGSMFPWVQKGASGYDLYLMQFGSDGKFQAQYPLVRLDAAVQPILSRSRPSDARARWMYWLEGERGLRMARLDGTDLRAPPRTIGLPFRGTQLLGRGVTDGRGGLMVPIWVPGPKGTAGSAKVLCIDERGGIVSRVVGAYATMPTLVATAVDASSNLLLAIAHDDAVDSFRVDVTASERLPAIGTRVMKLADGWAPAALAFEVLPDQAERAGGLSMITLLTRKAADGTQEWRSTWSDLSGKVFANAGPAPWAAPGAITAFLPRGYAPFYYLTRDDKGALWYGVEGTSPVKLPDNTPGTLWPSADAMNVRAVVKDTVVRDRALGPLQN